MIRDHHLSILGLTSRATWSEVVQSYHNLCKVWHPDRFGEDQQLLKLAEEKIKDINAAFEYLKSDSWFKDDRREQNGTDGKTTSTTEETEAKATHYQQTFSSDATPDWTDYFPTPAQMVNLLLIAVILGSVLATYRLTRLPPSSRQQRIAVNRSQEFETFPVAALPEAAMEPQPQSFEASIRAEEEQQQPLSEDHSAEMQTAAINEMSETKPVEIPGNIRQGDKLLVLASNKKVVEKIINQTPGLVDASIACDTSRARSLLDQGINPNQADRRGDSALIWAVKRRCMPVAKLLLDRGADINRGSENGFSPYAWARVYGSDDIGAMLARRGADTRTGSYWWRNAPDVQQAWLDQSLATACKNKNCR